VAIAVGVAFDASLGVAVATGAAVALGALTAAVRYQHTRRDAGTHHPILFPSVPSDQ
jgi:hypothetical protein